MLRVSSKLAVPIRCTWMGHFTPPQLYTVHAKVYDQMFPLIYGLLPNRLAQTYERFLTILRNEVLEVGNGDIILNPNTIMVDYELGAIQAIRRTLPGTQVKWCLFHYGQAINRGVQRIGLAAQYRAAEAGDPLRRWIRRLSALPLVPLDQVDHVFDQAIFDAPQVQGVDDMHTYMRNTWLNVDARFPRDLWNQYTRMEESRTINSLEGWHNKINRYVGKPHPNIFELIQFLQKEELFQRTELMRLQAGGQANPRKPRYIRLDQRIQRLNTQFQNGERNTMEYVDAVAYLL